MAYCTFCMRKIADNLHFCPFCGRDQTARPAAHHLKPGTVIGRKYRLGAALGEGGFGITYVGFDTALELRVAIKEFFPYGFVNRIADVTSEVSCSEEREKLDFFQKGRARFMQEARALARFSGARGIVDVRDFFEENNTAYIVMEFVDGVTLKQYLKDHGTLSPEETLRLLTPVMESLTLLHRENLIHRDISPDNIMITNGEVKLLDFGAARSVGGDQRSLSVLLKPGYAPFEQYQSHGKQGPWTDVYALCATMYKCITGVRPDESASRLYEESLKAPSALGVAIDPQMEAALLKGLSVRTEDRWQTVDALLSELNAQKAQQQALERERAAQAQKEALEKEIAARMEKEMEARLQQELEARLQKEMEARLQKELAEREQKEQAEREQRERAEREQKEQAAREQQAREQKEREQKAQAARERLARETAAPAQKAAAQAAQPAAKPAQPDEGRTAPTKVVQAKPASPKQGNSLLAGKKQGDLITFGAYPQSRVTDPTLLSELERLPKQWVSYGYYSGTGNPTNGKMKPGNFMQFADLNHKGKKYRAVRFEFYRPGRTGTDLFASAFLSDSEQKINGYHVNSIYFFRFEPLQWRILDPKQNLILCEYIVDSQPYQNDVYQTDGMCWKNKNKTVCANDYGASSIRCWLNTDFYKTACLDSKQDMIEKSRIEYRSFFGDSSGSFLFDSAFADDQIFLLSFADVHNLSLFENMNKRKTYGTDYAKCQGLYGAKKRYSNWWLRTQGNYSGDATVVCVSGETRDYYGVGDTSIGVRPALRLKEGV